MRRNSGLLFFLSYLTINSIFSVPQNLYMAKQALIEYHDNGQYSNDLEAVDNEAMNYLRFRINHDKQLNTPKHLAVVFDIDETCLSNYADLKALDFGGTQDIRLTLEREAHDPSIPFTQKLYQLAIDNKIAVFFISGRRETELAATEQNLKNAGYTQWAGLFLAPNDYNNNSISHYKTAIRKKITEEGYDIAINIGDQLSDLNGGYADMQYKLPNPFYYIG